MGDGPSVLVVEDDPNTRKVLTLILELRGYDVLESEDGEGGLELAERLEPALLVCDLQLPGMSGLELAETVARRDGKPPMVAITSGPESLVQRAKECPHFAEVLRKPVDVNELLDLVDRLSPGGRTSP